ncbi:MAG: rhodanese-like domain-containing protein [Leptospiraceae bacterium]|nr:rhodanese-like domain-containing protein [Leptospiraceae bacterium]MCP5496061.1 rhodanese-like domain-containing protein [Leptospiraceae bacterium]
MKRILLLLIVFLFGLQVYAADKVSLVNALKSGAIVVDVRTPFEYGRGHYNGAINIPVDQISMRHKELGKKGQNIIVYCRSGRRSEIAKNNLMQMGFTNVFNGGSLADMMSNGYLMGAK